MKFKALTEI